MKGHNQVSDIFSPLAIKYLKESLVKSNGKEIFWGCFLNESKNQIDKVETIFYGSYDSVVFSIEIATNYDLVLHNHPNNCVDPSEEDQNIAYLCMENAVGFAIVDNNLQKCYIIIPPHKIMKRNKINLLKIEDLFINQSNKISKLIENYKIRDSQIDLSKLIMKIINEDKVGFIEAPTGIGKSLAYILPALLYIKKNKVKVILSTYTKNLQNQLFIKDLPSAIRILNSSYQIEIAYGRQNYLCLLAYTNFKQSYNSLFYELIDHEQVEQLEKWVKQSQDGLLLNLTNDFDKKMIDEIRSSSSQCLGSKCDFYTECYYYNARRRLNSADIIITNHHYLLSYELHEERSEILPPYNTIIFDEGHNLPDVIESISTINFSTYEIIKKVFKLFNEGKNLGILVLLESKIQNIKNIVQSIKEKILKEIDLLKSQISATLGSFSTLQNRLIYDIEKIISKDETNDFSTKKILNLTEISTSKKNEFLTFFSILEEPFDNLQKVSDTIIKLKDLVNFILDKNEEEDTEDTFFKYIYANLNSNIDYFMNISQFYDELIACKDEKQSSNNFLKVLWVEISNNIIHFYFYNEELGASFINLIKLKAKSSIILSATMATEDSFKYIKDQLYIDDNFTKDYVEKVYPSIFPYDKNSSLFIIRGINPINKDSYRINVLDTITKILNFSKAKMMILSTSYKDIKDISEGIKKNKKNVKVFSQGENFFNNILLQEFKKSSNGVLIVNMSFWEGIDLVGKQLEILVITKLPFKVPDTPVLQAKTKRLEKNGLNSFTMLSLPYAIIKLKQGFGRLIRSEEDTGICILFDDRILTKIYGKNIINSLPKTKIEIISQDEFFEAFVNRCNELSITI